MLETLVIKLLHTYEWIFDTSNDGSYSRVCSASCFPSLNNTEMPT